LHFFHDNRFNVVLSHTPAAVSFLVVSPALLLCLGQEFSRWPGLINGPQIKKKQKQEAGQASELEAGQASELEAGQASELEEGQASR